MAKEQGKDLLNNSCGREEAQEDRSEGLNGGTQHLAVFSGRAAVCIRPSMRINYAGWLRVFVSKWGLGLVELKFPLLQR